METSDLHRPQEGQNTRLRLEVRAGVELTTKVLAALLVRGGGILPETEGPCTTTLLSAGAGHVAGPASVERRTEVVRQAVATVALRAILETGVGEALRGARGLAGGSSHGGGRERGVSERAVRAVRDAACGDPCGRSRGVGGSCRRRRDGRNGARGLCHGRGGGRCRRLGRSGRGRRRAWRAGLEEGKPLRTTAELIHRCAWQMVSRMWAIAYGQTYRFRRRECCTGPMPLCWKRHHWRRSCHNNIPKP